jgi:hypothetical protein
LRPGEPTDRNGLFGVLQGTEAGGPDSWIGHPQIDPGKGKRPVAAPGDTKGRKDLFDVLHARAPGELGGGAVRIAAAARRVILTSLYL